MSPVRNQPSSVQRSALLGRVVVARPRPTGRAPGARPSSRRPTGSRCRPRRARAARRAAAAGPAWRVVELRVLVGAGEARPERADRAERRRLGHAPGVARRQGRGALKRGSSLGRGRAADDHPLQRERSHCRVRRRAPRGCRARSSARRPRRDAARCSNVRAGSRGSRCGPGNTMLRAEHRRDVRHSPTRWRGTSARPAASCPAREPRPSGFAEATPSVCRIVERCE